MAAPARFFALNEDCFLVLGAVQAAVYQLSSGEVYAVDRAGRAVLEQVEQGVPVERIMTAQSQATPPAEMLDFLRRFEALGLGRFTELPARDARARLPSVSFGLRKIWLELTTRCNLRCLHCYADASTQPAPGGLSLETWHAVIVEAAALGASWLQFIGGEPLLFGRKNLAALIEQARRSGFAVIEVFTNATLLDDDLIDLFSASGVQAALSIYGNTAEVHDQVTQIPGSFQRTVTAARKLRAKGIPVRFGFVAMRHNQDSEAQTRAWLRAEFADAPVSCDVIRCTAGGREQPAALLTPELFRRQLRAEPVFPQFTAERFARARCGHPCLLGQVCVQADGSVYPCIMDRSHALGSLRDSSLASIVEGAATQEVWRLSKDRLPVCRDCEYRYACMDCRPLAVHLAQALRAPEQGLYASDPCCLYDPYTGTWSSAGAFMQSAAVQNLLMVPLAGPSGSAGEVSPAG